MDLVKYFDKLFQLKKEKGWEYLYIMVDVHNTILKPTYTKAEIYDFFPYAKSVLNILSKRPDMKLIMWSSSYPDVCEKYREGFKKYDIVFDYINENPEIDGDYIRCFIRKFYYDLGIDDKFGFDPETDWKPLYDYLTSRL